MIKGSSLFLVFHHCKSMLCKASLSSGQSVFWQVELKASGVTEGCGTCLKPKLSPIYNVIYVNAII